ncbi:LLM class flavin-dependent oxidoreductase [Streptomonospora nanhaiensis]|uniref:Alkanesulfonate monooxygenase SsuD/methylene tetrahydromethanopterin reductase-like flavin-dependent oxidoreductase (Luciferase family) n=1 Tax=Streptomonospora nanhaiensis TaxID=1323731 RepID=A0A853BHT8_9ACTN|nr:LLM class flavin-dependent oxidoreductase [Streptomonospora nanhaiensis]MBX9387473.1 LLM class flavin-dependent oxidoreductase [Streptomonospora nanhaiensis]NYI94305.1 alkanesulfonate monooxygenase SsuD/methylene tetrahydromethanopterin reductase-like flavin-dependent oxidoreductase (luciferase family) [Streptomonospora nanhaiensis]
MRISTTLPATPAGAPDLDRAAFLEELGYDSLGVPDLLLGDGTPGLDPVVVLAAAAGRTRRIGLEFGVLSLPLRPVALVAAQVQALQHVSGGRVVLGVGIGGFPHAPFWEAAGAAATGRGRRLDAALAALPGLLRGEATAVPGSGGRAITLAPSAPVPPVLVGGNSEAAMRRAVRHGAGWAPSLVTPEELAEGTARLREIADELGRPVPAVTVGGHAVLSDDPAAVEGFVRTLVEAHGMSEERAARLPVTGGPEQVAERLAAYAEAGAQGVGLSLDGARWEHQAETLARARALVSTAAG